jgi:ABC-type multidrug transport system fused ATPase/permease subunit
MIITVVIVMILIFCRGVIIFLILQISTTRMHEKIVEKVIRAKVLFFDSNPIGRIQTRFSKDVTVLDHLMPRISTMMTDGIFRALSVTITICFIKP